MPSYSEFVFEVLRTDGEFTLYRGRMQHQPTVLALAVSERQAAPGSVERLAHEYALAPELQAPWAARPLALIRHEDRQMLVLEDSGGEPLDRILEQPRGQPLELTSFLRLASELSAALAQVHRHGLIHEDLKPANVLVDAAGQVRLMGFGIASRLRSERQAPGPPESIAGTLPYMAPEQTGPLLPDLSVKYLHLVAHAERDKDGQLAYIGAIHDVTQRHQAEEALGKVRSELAHVTRVTTLGVLAASIAHEVSQPLSGIVTNSSTCLRMLAASPPNVEGARETLRRTIRDGHRVPVDLNETTREVIALSWNELQSGRIVLRTELPTDLPAVIGDRVQLQQVILNLLLNAADAMSGVVDHSRLLVIRTEIEGGERVRLSVQDSGVGFEPEALNKLFEAFYSTKSDGMGMGLSVSRSIIESHHGRLWASLNGGCGATFSFSLLRAAEDVTSAPARKTPAAPKRRSARTL